MTRDALGPRKEVIIILIIIILLHSIKLPSK